MKSRPRLYGFRGPFSRYLVAGIGASLLDLALFTVFSSLAGLNEVLSNVLSTVITVCASYFVNTRLVFRVRKYTWESFLSFAAVTLITGIVVQSLMIWGIIQVAQLLTREADIVVLTAAKLIAMGVGAIANYVGYKVIFRRAAKRSSLPTP